MLWHLPRVTDRTRLSTAMEKSTGDGMHPCIKPLFTLKGSVCWLLCITRHSMFSEKDWMKLSNIFWIPWCRRIFHSDGRCRLSVAFPMSTNTTYIELFYSCDCSWIWRKTNMWSLHDFTFLKHACSWRSSLTSAVVIRWRMPRRKTMLVMDRSVMPLQLLRSDKFRLFGCLMILPASKSRLSPYCSLRPVGCVEEAVAYPVFQIFASLHAHCRPQLLYRSSAF